MEAKKIKAGYLVKDGNRMLTRANPDWGGAMFTEDTPQGVRWRYFPTLEEALDDAEAQPLAEYGERFWAELKNGG